MNIRLRLLAALSITLVSAGCGMFSGSRPPAPPVDPSTGSMVVLYHVHLGDSDDETFTDHNVYLNGTRVGRLNAGEEMRLPVAPGISEVSIVPEMKWIGSTRHAPLKYSVEMAKGGAARYLRYRTASGQGRIVPLTGVILADRDLTPVTEQEYSARN
jgi:hypothetical protein